MKYLFAISFLIFFTKASIAQKAIDYYDKGVETAYTDKDSTYYYYQKSIDLFKEEKDLYNQLIVLQRLLYVNGYYYDLRSLKNNLKIYNTLLSQEDAKSLEYYKYFYDSYYLEQINYNFKISNLSLAQKYIDSLETYMDSREYVSRDVDYYEIALNKGLYQGSIYKAQNKPNLALEKYKQLEGYIQKHKDSFYDAKNSSFAIKRLQAKAYATLGKVDQAILTQIQALEIISNDTGYANSQLDIELDLTTNLIATNELKDAADLIKLIEAKKIDKGLFKIRLLTQKIELSRIQKDDQNNRKFHQEKLVAITNYRESENHPEVIDAYIKYAADELYWEDLDAAYKLLNKASSLLPSTFEINNSFTLTKLRLELASQYLKTYQATKNQEKLAEDILAKTQDVITSLDILQPQFESKLDKQYLINSAYPSLQTSFVLMYELYQSTKDRVYLDQAFAISEKSKAIELRSIRQAGIAQQSLNINPEIIETENLYNYTINQLEKDLFIEAENDQLLQDSLVRQKEAYGDFVADLRDSNPNYYNLRYKNDVSTLPQSVDYQAENTATISFFQVEEMMYAIVIEKENPRILKISYSEDIKKDIRDYYKMISAFKMSDQETLTTLSNSLYTKFIASSFPNKLPQSITIIPDGLLHYIPFEALKDGGQYLVQRATISYKPSVSFMQGLYIDDPFPAEFYGFAPRFNGKGVLAPLAYNEEEIEKANTYFRGTTFKGNEGSLVRFRESVNNGLSTLKIPIYHLATHAITNDTLPEYSYLAFTPKADKEDYILYAKDLYTERLNGAMVVLSACETGLGKLENGQGMQSLAQGFNYAGASSLLYSKWKVSDRYTAKIMTLFYKNLDKGLHKDKALQQAKIEYLNTTDDPNLKHPFYWASFVFSGDVTPLESTDTIPKWLWIIGALLIVGILGKFLKVRLSR